MVLFHYQYRIQVNCLPRLYRTAYPLFHLIGHPMLLIIPTSTMQDLLLQSGSECLTAQLVRSRNAPLIREFGLGLAGASEIRLKENPIHMWNMVMCSEQSCPCPEAVRRYSCKSGFSCCLLACPFNISCLELNFSFFPSWFSFFLLFWSWPHFLLGFYSFLKLKNNILQSLSTFSFQQFSSSLQTQ